MRRTMIPLLAASCIALMATRAQADSLVDGGSLQTFTVSDHVTGLGDVTDFRFLPDGRMVIVEKSGTVRIRHTDGTLVVAGTFPVDSSSEKGLLGVEVHPAFDLNSTLFFYYSLSDAAGGTDLDRHRVVSVVLKPDETLDMSTQQVLVHNLRGPANHDGGALAIGPDGKLYIGVGDTGCNSNAGPGTVSNWFGTCLTVGNGKILRVNLDGTIPADNPLANVAAATACGATCTDQPDPAVTGAPRKEIYAWGFRNPFRISFDRKTGNLWVGDVGEITFEELNIVHNGKHYGWPLREGAQGQDAGTCAYYTPQSGACVDPIYYCQHGSGITGIDPNCISITGGTFVDTCSWPTPYRGSYFFADNQRGSVWYLQVNATRDAPSGPGARVNFASITGGGPVSFQVGPDGNLYAAVYPASGNGRIVKFAPISPLDCNNPDGGNPDAGNPDGGTGPGPHGGCGCSTSGVGGTLVLAMLAFTLGRRRRS